MSSRSTNHELFLLFKNSVVSPFLAFRGIRRAWLLKRNWFESERGPVPRSQFPPPSTRHPLTPLHPLPSTAAPRRDSVPRSLISTCRLLTRMLPTTTQNVVFLILMFFVNTPPLPPISFGDLTKYNYRGVQCSVVLESLPI